MTRKEAINKWIIPAIRDIWIDEKCDEIIKALDQGLCEDCISRQAAIDAICKECSVDDDCYKCDDLVALRALPSATPQPKMGHWITQRTIMHDGEFYCDVCDNDAPFNKTFHFCSNCRAKMTESEGQEMSYSFECTLHNPLTKEDWNKITDVEFEKTTSVTFQTPYGRQVRFIKCEVLDKIRDEIEQIADEEQKHDKKWAIGLRYAVKIIDKYKAECEG